ncbi:MAG TPA: DUF992 domain-containing protein [Candidatus Binataceae bacterium]|nr:DUF992 domain-containing protein [Candidatus Binataceae bacterium]
MAMRIFSGFALIASAALIAILSCTSPALADGEVKIGYLSCNVASGWGIIFGSSRELQCTFTPAAGQPIEHYKGEINKFGADIGYLQSGVMLWTVFAPSTSSAGGALAGHYAGGTASATVGIGAGVHAMVGGMHSSISLQPVSVEGNSGLNVAAGVATMNLDYVMPNK